MIALGTLHIIYIVMTLAIIIALLFKREIVLPCIIGVLLMAFASSGNPIAAVQVMYNALVTSATQFLGIIIVIALVVAMSQALGSIAADELMIRPFKKVIRSNKVAFFAIGCVMLIASWFIWPSPAVALVGGLLLPVALEAGLPAIWAAVAMNIFGHGIGLSSDYFIQGAPSITGKAAGISTLAVMQASVPLWAVMSVVTIGVSFVFFLRDLKANAEVPQAAAEARAEAAATVAAVHKPTRFSYVMSVVTPLAFVLDVVLMIVYHIVGGDATALVGGTAVVIMSIITLFRGNLLESLSEIADHTVYGFTFAIKIFAPVIVIAAFFFMGSGDLAKEILGKGAPSILNDIGMDLARSIPMSKIPIAFIQAAIGFITGLDGSGFSGLPLVGSLAHTFSVASGAKVATLAALGQIVTVWCGGGTIIPWGVIPVASICNVKAADLARKNLIPVLCGMVATVITAIILM